MPLPAKAAEVLDFWTGLDPADWYGGGAALDQAITDRFRGTWDQAHAGGLTTWASCPDGMLAYVLLTDQFPRNMFRGDARAFATDAMARGVCTRAWHKKRDLMIAGPLRQFMYVPFMHAEDAHAQTIGVCLMASRLPGDGTGNLLHARVHREIIRRFRRFPYRNAALGRQTTAAEAAFMATGGYNAILQELQD
tara:strand:- start:9 stop:587 length:579 start_codon:yes stop_codon:yes gene_type:complete